MLLLRARASLRAAAVAGRAYASSAVVALDKPLDEIPALAVNLPGQAAEPVTTVTTLSNGVKVATYENFGPASSVAVVVKAGARHEDSKTLGAAQFLKHFALQSTYNRTHVRLTREVELLGGDIVATATRENVIYAAQFLRSDLATTLDVVADLASAARFHDFEVHDVAHKIETESATALANPHVAVFEALHRAAFRGTLGNPLYASESTLHHMSATTLKQYAAKNLNGGQVTIVGAGVNHDDLVRLAATVFDKIGAAASSAQPAKYVGGELRLENVHDPVNRYALAFEGAGYASPDFVPLLVLSKVLGGGKHIKYGSGVSALARASAKLGRDTSLTAFNISYSDAGLFGVYTESSVEKLNEAVDAGVAELKKTASTVSADDLARGKAQAHYALKSAYETRTGAVEDVARQAAAGYKTPNELAQAVEKVTAHDLTHVAKKLLAGKPSAVAYGDVINAPFAAGLKL